MIIELTGWSRVIRGVFEVYKNGTVTIYNIDGNLNLPKPPEPPPTNYFIVYTDITR